MYVFMANFSGTNIEEIYSQGQGCVHGECSMPTFQHQQTISIDWRPDEDAILQEGLLKYASESGITRYVKIAAVLKDKTIRDVALRCRWMTKKHTSKRRKEDISTRRSKDRKTSETQGI